MVQKTQSKKYVLFLMNELQKINESILFIIHSLFFKNCILYWELLKSQKISSVPYFKEV